MAKKSAVERNKKRERMAQRYQAKRERLRAVADDPSRTMEERFAARLKLAEVPRNSARVRVQNRCALTGRSKAVYRKFKLCRVVLRDLAADGQIPGMVKSSW